MLQSIKNEDNDQVTNTAGAFQSDGRDVEFSQELADHDDLVAQERSKAADQRAKARKNNNQ
ncbi:YfhD family protein [Bacillus sp. FJAT-42315]|uniref:YfhD family protein n=1 Tax=Bacillus sp. FJAT-42315 TaxID=2014077 RepID=UPI000C244346|nr:YfhD family protein [Bacillus sp. FJAT-42315]